MYKSESKNRKAASIPKQRDMPFDIPNIMGLPNDYAKNDPVGTQEYASNPYRTDKKLNWVDRS